MPIYTFHDNNTGEQWDDLMGISEADVFLEKNPHIKKVPVSINLIGGVGDRIRPDNGMKEVFSRIAEANPTTPLAERYGSKGIKESKTRNALNRVRKKLGGSMV